MPNFNLLSCKICKKPFNSFGSNICPKCLDEIDKAFVDIRDYLYENPGDWNAAQLSEATGISKEIVLHLIKQERLTTKDTLRANNFCTSCKKPISSGKLCEPCRQILSKQLSDNVAKSAEKENRKNGSHHRTRDLATDRRPRSHSDRNK